jgi:hypothetical protein
MSKILTKSLIGSPDVSYSDAPLVSVPFSSVANRAKIRDLSKDMAPLFGINRIPVQQIIELQNESGPNGERVHAPLYDTDGLIRFVGDWTNANAANGPRIETSALTTDYVEITFYGTALNILMGLIGTGYNIVASIDGGPEGSNRKKLQPERSSSDRVGFVSGYSYGQDPSGRGFVPSFLWIRSH